MLNQSKPFLGKDTVFSDSIYSYTVIQFYFGGIVSTIYDIINIYIYIYINNKDFSKNGESKNKLYIV